MNHLRLLSLFCLAAFCLRAETPRSSTPQATATVQPLKQILLADSLEAAQKLDPQPDKGYIVIPPHLSFLNAPDVEKIMAEIKGRPIDEKMLIWLSTMLADYLHKHDYPVADVVVPTQSLDSSGALRVAVLLGKYREIRVQGNRWFSESLLRQKLGIEKGEIIHYSELNRAVDWTNASPFRRVRLQLNPEPNTGESDLTIAVQERLPLRLAVSYDDTGNEILGERRYTAGLMYANVLGLDHQASYQYTTTDKRTLYQSHLLDYRVPLPSHHVIALTAGYTEVKPTFYYGYFTQVGKSVSANLKYSVPLTIGGWETEIAGAIDFKQSNNNLEFVGIPVLGVTTDQFAAIVNTTSVRSDTRGRWIVSSVLTASPGHLNSRNEDEVFQESRPRTHARYFYGQVWLQRITVLSRTLAATTRVAGQLASTNLLAGDEFSVGGSTTVRGYNERVIAGDNGYMLTQEFQQQFPTWQPFKKVPSLSTAGVLFWDYGRVFAKFPSAYEYEDESLSSAGVGLRASIGTFFNASVTYGRQLKTVSANGTDRQRFHVRMTLAY